MRVGGLIVLVGLIWPSVSVTDPFPSREPAAVDGSLSERRPTHIKTNQIGSESLKHVYEMVAMAAPQRSAKKRPTVSSIKKLAAEIAGSHDMDTDLVKAVIHAESSFNPSAVSRCGATGLMQLMPYTAEQYGVRDATDPSENIRGGVLHLKYLLGVFDNDISLALAAYNAGVSTVRKYQGIPPYPETQAYVKKVLKLRRSYNGTIALNS